MSKIREMIAESGKMKVTDAVAYVMRNMPEADKKEVTREAKEMIADAKKFNRQFKTKNTCQQQRVKKNGGAQ